MRFTINSECGVREFEASSIDEAKERYAADFGYDFANYEDYPGSWYYIADEQGGLIEAHTECMP